MEQVTTSEVQSLTNEAPLFVHDCQLCAFLGSVKHEGQSFDLYVHRTGIMPTVIARFGSHGPEYTSGLPFAYGTSPLLTEARMRAQAQGLLEYDVQEALMYAKPGTPCVDELRNALPSTLEYQMWQAFQNHNETKWKELANQLLQQELERPYSQDRSRNACVMDLETRVHRVLTTMEVGNEIALWCDIERMTGFLWESDDTNRAAATV